MGGRGEALAPTNDSLRPVAPSGVGDGTEKKRNNIIIMS